MTDSNDTALPPGAVAVVGMAGRFPGARDLDQFWANLTGGVESIRTLEPSELREVGVPEEEWSRDDYVPAAAPLERADRFDASFFGYLPREAELMDPQHRHFLECAWEALEHAGYDPSGCPGRVGVFGGVARNTYLLNILRHDPSFLERVGEYQGLLGSEKDFPATRVAYKLGLRGPCVNVQTACSTSGVAMHLACQGLLSGECDMALAGGGRILVPQKTGYRYQEGGILSPDGHCRAFDAEARGTVRGSGMAFVALKRLEDALDDGDTVHAVIRGTAVNNDGAERAGYTTPGVRGQAEVVAEALAVAGVTADTIDYVEAHGTGTPVGDPIEVAALTRAFQRTTDRTGYCAIGSLKTNVGHLDAGAGVAGVVKTALALRHEKIPPSLHFSEPNPEIDFESSPFFVNAELREWPRGDAPRRAGVSTFGLGGTNAHLVLEEAPREGSAGGEAPDVETGEWQLLPLSARTDTALEAATGRLADHLASHPELRTRDVAFTLQAGRRAFERRRFAVCRGREHAVEVLRGGEEELRTTARAGVEGRPVAFLFPGGGAQHPGMGSELYAREATYREALEACLDRMDPELERPVRRLLLEADGSDPEAGSRLERPSLALPALFSTEYALARLLDGWGIRPDVVAGHSLGEYVAACVADVLSVEDALDLVSLRGRLFEELPEGGMAAVPLPPREVEDLDIEGISVAVVNRPSACVVSGSVEGLDALDRVLETREVESRRLHISVAAHSPMVDPILDRFREAVEAVELSPPRLRYLSNVTGDWADEEVAEPEYWVRHLRSAVRFSDDLGALFRWSPAVTLQMGPGRSLASFARMHPERTEDHAVIRAMRHPDEEIPDPAMLLRAIGHLWAEGVEVDWKALHGGRPRRVPLPTYPFEGDRHWIDVESAPADPAGTPTTARTDEASAPSAPASEDAADQTSNTTREKDVTERHQRRVRDELFDLLSGLSGLDPDQLGNGASFLELGFESLSLTQVSTAVKRTFGVDMGFRALMEDCRTPVALADRIADEVEPQEPEEPEVEATAEVDGRKAGERDAGAPGAGPESADGSARAPAADGAPEPRERAARPAAPDLPTPDLPAPASASSRTEQVILAQLETMREQLALIRGDGRPEASPAPETARGEPDAADAQPRVPAGAEEGAEERPDATGATSSDSEEEDSAGGGFGPWKPNESDAEDGLTDRQRAHLAELTRRVEETMGGSKELTQENRRRLADPRTVEGFRRAWKEVVLPVVADASGGARIRDVDGNEYVDVAMGFGVALLGHNPPFVRKALEEHVGRGFAIGPQTPLAGEVAELVHEMTGMERVAFCNTGSEAVLAAIRTARTVTGRDEIVTFAGSYHGIFDEVLARSVQMGEERTTMPIAPGIPSRMVEGVNVLEYGDPASLDAIARKADDLAAVLVEPVQSRNPDHQPKEFVQKLRALTAERDVPLVFDEMITGFRSHPGGVQALWDVEADIATYGKVVGGGMPIGVVTGKRRFMDALDGGHWRYGDDSIPEAGVTWFAGTFVRHPLSLAAARATLGHLKEEGPKLQRELTARTEGFVEELNRRFRAMDAPIRVESFASFFLLRFLEAGDFASLFYFHLREKGVHITEGRAAFLSTAHTDEDLEFLADAFEASAREMQEGGFLPGGTGEAASTSTFRRPERTAVAGADTSAGADEALPLTEGQREIWTATRVSEDANRAFNLSNSVWLEGALDEDLMVEGIRRLARRHDGLRTTFDPEGPTQRVHPALPPEIERDDLSGLEPDERERRIEEARRRQVETPFDLEEGPLFRAHLLRTGPETHLLLMTAHHIVCDGWSCGVLIRELGEIYRALSEGREPDLDDDPAGLPDYVRMEREARERGEMEAAEEYWLERFEDGVPTVELPTDRPRPPEKTYRARRVELDFADELHESLKGLAASRDTTLFTLLLAAFNALLHRLSGDEEFVVGISSAGQNLVGERDLVGHCVNLLPFRTRVEGDEDFAEHLARERSRLLDAFEHQRCTFGSLVERLSMSRDPGRVPLVPLVFNVDPTLSDVDFGGLEVEASSNPRSFEIFDLFFNVVAEPGRFRVECTFNEDLLDEETVARLLRHYRVLLEGALEDADRPVERLPLMDDEGRRQVVEGFNDTDVEYPSEGCLHELIQARVERCPNAVALRSEEEEDLTYAEMDWRANALAHRLRDEGVGPGTVVGICAERSPAMVVGLLGILKAGGAYLPLDPEYPPERLSFMVDDAGAPLALVQPHLEDRLVGVDVETLVLDPENGTGRAPLDPPESGVADDDLAYILYTSGSTGRPKGVMIEHRQIRNRLFWAQDLFELGPDDAVVQKTPFTFDVSVPEFFWTLMTGARLVVARPGGHMDSRYLAGLIEREGGTWIHFVPSMLEAFLEQDDLEERCASLRHVVCSGEALTRGHIEAFQARMPESVRLHNLYGPTEAAVDVSHWPVSRGWSGRTVPIGSPGANTRLYVLDPDMEPLPVGLAGELWIGGVQVGRGYRNRPELTAEHFVPDPFDEGDDARLYRTGDRARWRNDGTLEFLGRLDDQVKLRGFRIELGEVESVLMEQPDVRRAVAMVREDGPPGPHLVAYLVPEPGRDPARDDLRAALRRHLPEHMVPTLFVEIDEVPLTSSGKADRSRLPAPETGAASNGSAPAPPRTETERRVLRLWTELLGRNGIGAEDDFFEVGGQSLLATRLVTRIADAFGVEVPLSVVFREPTVRGLADRIDRARPETGSPAADTDSEDLEEIIV